MLATWTDASAARPRPATPPTGSSSSRRRSWSCCWAGEQPRRGACRTAAQVPAPAAHSSPRTSPPPGRRPPPSRIDIAWTAAGQLAGATYAVTRTTGSTTTTLAGCTSSPCADTGLASGTTFTYTVTSQLGGWTRSGTTTGSTQVTSTLTSFAVSVAGSPQAGVAQNVTVTARDQQGAHLHRLYRRQDIDVER